jgi:hypothetical protein
MGYYNECKTPATIMGPIWDIAMNLKTNYYYGTHMGHCNEFKNLATIMGSYMQVLQCMYKTSGY